MLHLRPLTLVAPLLLLGGVALANPAAAPNGMLLAQSCLGCHGAAGQGEGAVPGIAGLPAPDLVAQMAAFRANERPATIMGRITRGYTVAEIEAVAAYLAQRR